MKSFPALAFLLLVALALLTGYQGAQVPFSGAADGGQIGRLFVHLKTIQQPTSEGR